ncbi:Rossmann-fold superfamily protein [Perilla frutescens var. hirtella]|nr:Rossmann-fold superfamily protein [Perilla frutescens var. hirtella]
MATSSAAAQPLGDRVAIVTGASRGIGRAIALHLASLGARVVINYSSNSAQAESLAAQINTGSDVRAATFRADISAPEQVKSLFDAAESAFNSEVHILVNSAGVLDPKYPSLADTAVEDFDSTFAINSRGAFLCCREAANRIKRGGGGRIICLTSSLVASLRPGYVAYTASKAAVEAMVRILAKELKGTGITANAVAPGPVATEMFFAGKTEEAIKKAVAECPFGRLGETDDVAPVVGFLATDAGQWPLYTPPPVGVAPTKNVGRAAFALQNLAAGEVLHSAKPVVAHPYLSMMNCVCNYCLRRLPKRDSGAEPSPTVSFCSELCEQSSKKFYDVEKQVDWSSFHEYCRERGLKYPLMVKRFACQIIARKIPTAMFDLLHGESLTPEKISLIKEEFSLLYSILDGADIKVEKDESKGSATKGEEENEELLSFLTEEWYADVLTRIRVNAFRVELPVQSYEDLHSSAAASVVGEAGVGNAIYMLPSFYNHSCDPNVNFVWSEDAEGKMVALRDIEEGEELRICYLDASMSYEARQKFLYEGYGFKCDCPRCVSKE